MARSSLTIGTIALVRWRDSWLEASQHWECGEIAGQPDCICMNVGFVVQNDSRGIGLAMSRYEGQTRCRIITFIPKPAILEACRLIPRKNR
jgi:hypothetical protein